MIWGRKVLGYGKNYSNSATLRLILSGIKSEMVNLSSSRLITGAPMEN